MQSLQIRSSVREELIDITDAVQKQVTAQCWLQGALMLFCPHTTCGLTINEGADPDVRRDVCTFLSALIPHRGDWRHAEGNSDAHVKSSFLGVSLLVPLDAGRLQLGTWQRIYLYEGDGARTRSVWLQLLASAH